MRTREVSFFLILLLLIHINGALAQEAQPEPIEVEVHKLINDERLNEEKHGVPLQKLELQSDLISIARTHSEDMANRDYFSHEDPEGNDVFDRLEDAGIDYQSAGENLFRSSAIGELEEMARDAVEGWINSPGHYKNILTDFTFTGIGYYEKDGQYFLTQVFVTASRSHLENMGVIYDNDNLDQFEEEEPTFFEKYITQEIITIIIIIVVILIGYDAQKRNREYRQRKSRPRRWR